MFYVLVRTNPRRALFYSHIVNTRALRMVVVVFYDYYYHLFFCFLRVPTTRTAYTTHVYTKRNISEVRGSVRIYSMRENARVFQVSLMSFPFQKAPGPPRSPPGRRTTSSNNNFGRLLPPVRFRENFRATLAPVPRVFTV